MGDETEEDPSSSACTHRPFATAGSIENAANPKLRSRSNTIADIQLTGLSNREPIRSRQEPLATGPGRSVSTAKSTGNAIK